MTTCPILEQRILLLGAMIVLVGGSPSIGKPQGDRVSEVHAPPISLVYFDEFAPLSFRGEDGRMTGILVDALEMILGDRMGHPLTHLGFPWIRAQEMVESGGVDAFCTTATESRQRFVRFSTFPVTTSRTALFSSHNSPRRAEIARVASLDDLEGLRIGDYLGNGWAEQNLASLDLEWSPSLESVLRKLAASRLDVYVGNDLVGRYSLQRTGLSSEIDIRPLDLGPPSAFHLGLRSNFPDADAILERFDLELEAAREDGRLAEIFARYLG